ncbi:MAG: aromatic amino acid hydroxylase [Bacteroidota bacterium]
MQHRIKSGRIPEAEIQAAADEVDRLQAQEVAFSEMAQIRNLQWWSVEYGLIGETEHPRIYGAGLLSSIGESQWCMRDEVEKLPYSIQAAHQGFDITRPQPQLFVTPDFPYLMEVLEEFANQMSVRKGGHKGLQKLIDSQMVGTIELSTGLQISGSFARMITNEDREVIFFQTTGPTALAYREKELIGHGVLDHPNGFCSPIGKLKSINLAIEDMGPVDLKAYNFYDRQWLSFEFESGIRVEGLNVTGIRNIKGKLMLIQLEDCTVSYQDEILFRPEEGLFNMAVGKKIVSAFAGAADYLSFPNLYEASQTLTHQPVKTEATRQLEAFYQEVRELRHQSEQKTAQLKEIFAQLQQDHPDDWLLSLEIYEMVRDEPFSQTVRQYLGQQIDQHPKIRHLIEDGVQMADEEKLSLMEK